MVSGQHFEYNIFIIVENNNDTTNVIKGKNKMNKYNTEYRSLGHCKYCNEEIFGTHHNKLVQHQRFCICNPNRQKAVDARKRGAITMNKKVNEKRHILKEKDISTKSLRTFYCLKCGNPYQLLMTDREYKKATEPNSKYKFRKYCSNKCSYSHKRNNSIKKKNPIKKKTIIKKIIPRKPKKIKQRICKKCGNIFHGTLFGINFCSQNCKDTYVRHISEDTRKKLSEAGKRSAAKQSEIRRSKNEILFCQLCEKHFKTVEHNKPIFNGWDADIIIYDINYAVLWNGRWHYVEIMKKGNTLKSIQNRDRLKEKEIKNANWNLYVIKDMGKYNPKFVHEKFDEFIKFLNCG